jgi:hypothetical protein
MVPAQPLEVGGDEGEGEFMKKIFIVAVFSGTLCWGQHPADCKPGVSPKVISERLGHSKVSFTLDQYVHLLPGMQEEAAAKIEDAMKAAREKLQPQHTA